MCKFRLDFARWTRITFALRWVVTHKVSFAVNDAAVASISVSATKPFDVNSAVRRKVVAFRVFSTFEHSIHLSRLAARKMITKWLQTIELSLVRQINCLHPFEFVSNRNKIGFQLREPGVVLVPAGHHFTLAIEVDSHPVSPLVARQSTRLPPVLGLDLDSVNACVHFSTQFGINRRRIRGTSELLSQASPNVPLPSPGL
jgi:hypothetical protein